MRRFFGFAARHPWMAIAGITMIALIGIVVVVAGGLVPITASSGHWAITEWFLHFAMRRSVVTHSLLVPDPPRELDSTAMVLRGAGHFESGCRSCHGAPGERLPAVPQGMTPHPPQLGPRMRSWDAAELFYIVKHGVKFTGMPAWPAQRRDDEVWAVVAFLRRLPDLSEREYQKMVWGSGAAASLLGDGTRDPVAPPAIVVESCARCHGRDGGGGGTGAFPKLAGQRFEYMARAMRAYADGRRHSGIMQPIAVRGTESARHEALRYFASLPAQVSSHAGDAGGARGALIAHEGVPDQRVPACATCHEAEPVIEAYPRLRGQYRTYLVQQLTLMQQRRRGGSEFVHIMHNFVERLTPEQIADVASYFAGES